MFGVRPLCFAVAKDSILLATDPEQVLRTGLVSTAPDDGSVIETVVGFPFQSIDRSFETFRFCPAAT